MAIIAGIALGIGYTVLIWGRYKPEDNLFTEEGE